MKMRTVYFNKTFLELQNILKVLHNISWELNMYMHYIHNMFHDYF